MIVGKIEGVVALTKQLKKIPSILKKELESIIIETAEKYLRDVKMHFRNMINSDSGEMWNTLRLQIDKDGASVGWFEDAPYYIKYVLFGTYKKEARNPLFAAYNAEKMFNEIKRKLSEQLGRRIE